MFQGCRPRSPVVFRGVVVDLCVTFFPREDAVIRSNVIKSAKDCEVYTSAMSLPPFGCRLSQWWSGILPSPRWIFRDQENFPPCAEGKGSGGHDVVPPPCWAEKLSNNKRRTDKRKRYSYENIRGAVVMTPHVLPFEEVRVRYEDHQDGSTTVRTKGSRLQRSSPEFLCA